jgi:hypothetical protein
MCKECADCPECTTQSVCGRCIDLLFDKAKADTAMRLAEYEKSLAAMEPNNDVVDPAKRTVRIMVGVDCRRPGDNWSCTCELMETGTCDYCIEKVEDDKELEIEMAQYRAAQEEREIDRLVHVARESRSMNPVPYVATNISEPVDPRIDREEVLRGMGEDAAASIRRDPSRLSRGRELLASMFPEADTALRLDKASLSVKSDKSVVCSLTDVAAIVEAACVEAAQVDTPVEEKRLYLNRWAHEDMLIKMSSVM